MPVGVPALAAMAQDHGTQRTMDVKTDAAAQAVSGCPERLVTH
jgi:hypothetical protein